MPTFDLEEKDWFTPQMVAENDFINEKNSPADLAKFGKTYAVKFEGDAETYMWTAKSEPEVGKEYFGHLQKTSGRSIRFKVDKEDDATTPQQGFPASNPYQDKSDSINRAVALKAAVQHWQGNDISDADMVIKTADKFLKWLENKEPADE